MNSEMHLIDRLHIYIYTDKLHRQHSSYSKSDDGSSYLHLVHMGH